MRRRKSGAAYRRERIIMIASSVLVLTAMTVTGLYIYNSDPVQEEENIVDFSVLEDEARQKDEEIARAQMNSAQNRTSGQADAGELDYDPYYVQKDRELNDQEVNAGASMKGQEKESKAAGQETAETNGASESMEAAAENETESQTATEAAGQAAGAEETKEAQSDQAAAEGEQALEAVANALQEEANLHFAETARLEWPIAGNVILNYSMDKTVYFETLQQYKYNPSIMIGATQGSNVACAADGVVKSVHKDPQTGNTVVMTLGDGYELTYGQLADVTVEEGELVEAGVFIGVVAAPTKYYTQEGTNVYFKLTKDGEPVDPLDYLG